MGQRPVALVMTNSYTSPIIIGETKLLKWEKQESMQLGIRYEWSLKKKTWTFIYNMQPTLTSIQVNCGFLTLRQTTSLCERKKETFIYFHLHGLLNFNTQHFQI